MSSTDQTKTAIPNDLNSRVLARILEEGYGPGAWHGPDMKAALDNVSAGVAFWRPANERHNIAEITLHHAYSVRYVRGQLSGTSPGPFVLEGEDWFPLLGDTLSWSAVRETLESEQERLSSTVADIVARGKTPPLTAERRFELVFGITCHAIYHAGQIELIKKVAGSNRID